MAKNAGQQTAVVCQECGAAGSVKQTVPWQPNICTVCGSDITEPDG